jgi:hypothetical protein
MVEVGVVGILVVEVEAVHLESLVEVEEGHVSFDTETR